MIGVDQSTISSWERSRWSPTIPDCNRMADALGLSYRTVVLWFAEEPVPGSRYDTSPPGTRYDTSLAAAA